MTLDYIFHPRSIAVAGASGGPWNAVTQLFLDTLIKFEYKGEIYPINPKYEEVSGLKAYPNVKDVPGPVDHVICMIPAAATRQLLEDCIAKGVKTVHLYTSGFAETGEEDRARLQDELVSIARSGGIRILGPNCMGIYYPRSGISFCADFPKDTGTVSFITQSGSYSMLVTRGAGARGVRFSKVVSYGNASDINETDLLEYLAHDRETEVIAAYIEGTRDGKRLRKVLTEAAAKKPVIIIKKGGTAAGNRGALSHTGALAGNDAVWEALLKQTGAIRVEDFEEMIDMLVTFQFFPLPRGRKVAVVGLGGGVSVRASDECERGGLTLPPAPEALITEIERIIPVAGSMLRNPFDMGNYRNDWAAALKYIDGWAEPDMFLWQLAPEIEPFMEGIYREFCRDARGRILEAFRGLQKPTAVVVHGVEAGYGLETLQTIKAMCAEHKMPFYPSVYRAARAISRYMDYHSRRGDKKTETG
ncbi:MAG: acetyl-CoA synthetase [Dehalococcoidia bacterium]|nr:acetyl-CoA synthetase [Dehalococcoidia bacterium]